MNVTAPPSDSTRWPRRVLMTADAVGGIWQYALDLACGFSRRGMEILLAVMGGAPRTHQLAAAKTIPGLHLVSAPYRLEWTEDAGVDVDASGVWLLTLARRFRPDVIHLNGYAHAVLPWDRPVVVAAHSCVRTWWRAVHGEDPPTAWGDYVGRVAAGLAAADTVIAPTHAFLTAMAAAYGRIERATIVHNGRAAAARPLVGKEPRILCAARLWDEAKNILALDAAAASLPWPVSVAGPTDRPDGAAGRTATCLRLLGSLSDAELRSWCDRAAIFVSPALYEPFGLAVLEAAQSGCALVLSDIPTLRELWDGAAIFVPPRDAAALHQALAELIAEADRRHGLAEAAVHRARRYALNPMVQGTLEVYSRAAKRRSVTTSGTRTHAASPLAQPAEALPVKIAFFGSSLVSAYWNGAATYYRGLLKALAKRGHEVTFYEPDAFDRQRHRDIDDPPWARVVVYPATEADVGRCLRHAARADVIVKASGVGVFDALLEEAVLELRRHGKRVAFWDVDAPATLERLEADPADPFRALIPAYDLVFTYGGGPPVIGAYSSLGARACIPIYNALDPSTHFPVESEARFRSDLTFVGNRLPDREARVEEFFISVAERLPRRRFLIGGSGWDSRSMPANVIALGHVYTRDHNALNCSARAVLNINRDSMARYGFSPPTRVFEAAGGGACLITDAWDGIEAFLTPGDEVLVAKNGSEVAELLTSLSGRRARCIGEMARARVLAHHTYARRAGVVDAVLRGAAPAAAEAAQ